jgi:hypothetical protein
MVLLREGGKNKLQVLEKKVIKKTFEPNTSKVQINQPTRCSNFLGLLLVV